MRREGTAWALDLLREAGLSESLIAALPRLAPANEIAPALAEISEIPFMSGRLVCLGSGDLGCTTIGALGSAGVGESYCYLGTSGWVATVRRGAAEPCGAFRVLSPLEDIAIVAAPMTTAGGNLSWLRATFFPELEPSRGYEALDDEACKVAPGTFSM